MDLQFWAIWAVRSNCMDICSLEKRTPSLPMVEIEKSSLATNVLYRLSEKKSVIYSLLSTHDSVQNSKSIG